MYQHERSLVREMKGKPFVLLGVNSDNKKRVKTAIRKNKISWRSWWDGGSTKGPIAKAWGVSAWPTIYVIDHKGIIRFKNVRGAKMDEAVEKLMAAAEADGDFEVANADAEKTTEGEGPDLAKAGEEWASLQPQLSGKLTDDLIKALKEFVAEFEGTSEAEQASHQLKAAAKLRLAKQYIKIFNEEKAQQVLEDLVESYPDSLAAKDAKKLLEGL